MPIIEQGDIPSSCLHDAPVVFGIDEAGRGPLLGTLFCNIHTYNPLFNFRPLFTEQIARRNCHSYGNT